MAKKFTSFAQFYPYYLQQHQHPLCRACHYLGNSCVLVNLFLGLYFKSAEMLLMLPIFGYGFAWLGHFLFERNHPATFSHPYYSFLADWVMYFSWLSKRR